MEENKSQSVFLIEVEKQDAGLRIDKFLAEKLPQYSRTRIKALLEEGYVKEGYNIITAASEKVREKQIINVLPPPLIDSIPQPEDIPLDIVYDDDDVIVINKPAGMVVHPAPGNYDKTLVNALLAYCGQSLSGINGVKRPGIVHRLDKETSGLLIVAKNDKAHQHLSSQLANRTLRRVYQAVSWGMITPSCGTIDLAIGRHPRLRKKMAVREVGGKQAITHYKKLHSFGLLASLVECRLETGRTHQIRVHLESLGYSIVGDKAYGKPPKFIPLALKEFLSNIWGKQRHALHAKSLTFNHPTRNEPLSFETELPQDMLRLLETLSDLIDTRDLYDQ